MAFHVATPLAKTPSRMAALLSFSPLFSSSNTGDATAACSSREHLCWSLSFASSAAASSSFSSSSAVAAAPAISASARLLHGSGSSSAIAACRSSIASCGGGRGFFSSAFASPAPAAGTTRRAPMTTNASSATAPTDAKSVHDFTVKDINGEDVDLSTFKGKVLLIVNVASACGLTQGNYSELTQIYSELKQAGLEVLAFPCNQFGGQEPGTNEQIKEFACSRYKAEFPIFDKVDVNGPKTAPLYQFLKKSKGGGILGDNIKWNFGKFLVNQDGVVVERYAPTTSPKKIEGDIKKLLGV